VIVKLSWSPEKMYFGKLTNLLSHHQLFNIRQCYC